jgi:hypothetical protein
VFSVGDIVEIFAPTAGHKKYHLCVCETDGNDVIRFLFINSHDGFEADFPIVDSLLPCLPKSPTGQSVFCCNMIVIYSLKQLVLYKAVKLGEMDKQVAKDLLVHMQSTKALNQKEKVVVINALKSLIPPPVPTSTSRTS